LKKTQKEASQISKGTNPGGKGKKKDSSILGKILEEHFSNYKNITDPDPDEDN